MNIPTVKGPKKGRCNICGKDGSLTEDHVPPKGVTRFPRMELHSLITSLGAKPGEIKTKGRHFQQGVKFRTTCLSCNRDLLGSQYDKALIKLSNKVSGYLFSMVARPQQALFSTQPGLVARAVCGHILSIGVNCPANGTMGQAMARFVLNPTSRPPPELKVYYWLYPYWGQVLVRSMGLQVRLGAPTLVCSLMKYMPLAFMVAWDPDPRLNIPYPNLMTYVPDTPDAVVEIPLDFKVIPGQHYPEAPPRDGITLHGRDAYNAFRQKGK